MPIVRATSDLHGNLPEVEPCDILLIAGDVAPDFLRSVTTDRARNGAEQQADWMQNVWVPWCESVPAKWIVWIAGNHDYFAEHADLMPDTPTNVIYLRDEQVTLEGLNIWGTPWVPKLARWAFYATEPALIARAEGIPERLDILLSHGPPYGILDCVAPMYGGPLAVGDIPLANALERLAPKEFICGHIHEGHGIEQHGPTTVRNVSLVNERYEVVNPVVTIPTFE